MLLKTEMFNTNNLVKMLILFSQFLILFDLHHTNFTGAVKQMPFNIFDSDEPLVSLWTGQLLLSKELTGR